MTDIVVVLEAPPAEIVVELAEVGLVGPEGGGGGGGAVDSVNTQVGVVVLDAADVGADATGSAATARAAAISAASTDATTKANAAQAAAVQRANHTGTQTSATISDFTEAAQDAVAAALSGVTGATVTYDDAAGTITITGVGDPETMRDTIGTALVGVGVVTVTVDDGANTITISSTATVNATDAALRDRSLHTGTQTMSTISDAGTAATVDTGTASGEIPLLSTGGVLPIARLATGTPDGTKFVRDDGTLVTPAGGGGTDFSDPSIQGMLSWVSDPILLVDNATISNNRIFYMRIPWPVTATPAKLWIATNAAAGTTRIADQCFAGLYSAAGTLLYQTADISTVVTATYTAYGLSLVSPASITGGAGVFLYGALLMNYTGAFNVAAPNNNTSNTWQNAGVASTSVARALMGGTGSTTLPASVTLSGLTRVAGFWMGVS